MSIEVRSITDEELPAYCEAVAQGFGGEVREGTQDRTRRVVGLDRLHGAFDDRNRVVGTSGAYTLQMAVPGQVDVATAGLTMITVAATHRRQGVLTSMMDAHFEDAVARNEPLSALWASEIAIYGRFGYGEATQNVSISYDARLAGIRRPERPDTVDLIDATEAQKVLPDIRERARVQRPGLFHRSPLWWEVRRFPDYEWMRDGASPRRHVMVSRDGEPVGYASYRQKEKWTETDIAEGQILLVELVGVDDAACHTLWWFLSNIDLFPKVDAHFQATDNLLPSLATNHRAIRRLVTDGIHVRVLDVAAALTARRYDQPGDLVFTVEDGQRPDQAGTYRLTVADDGTARCDRDDGEPSAELSSYALGALYLGGSRPEPLAFNGHLNADGPTVAAIRRMFSWPVAPYCDEMF